MKGRGAELAVVAWSRGPRRRDGSPASTAMAGRGCRDKPQASKSSSQRAARRMMNIFARCSGEKKSESLWEVMSMKVRLAERFGSAPKIFRSSLSLPFQLTWRSAHMVSTGRDPVPHRRRHVDLPLPPPRRVRAASPLLESGGGESCTLWSDALCCCSNRWTLGPASSASST
ncbi:hypothetical protein PVAP13_1KG142500 [Panicum virgatum]|uniref:Uncharacterized protein n=1 Tax=Panicum virgatum TaxID=38727 RepID=A0A8T0XL04_PANVG|nr:hypothetical protein PVAP13_1KG142500 [Panicum virgatum]KAG2657903.1 hypothetical protein PVAP13_1KG142500 [Panicum virgatum]